VDTTKAAKRSVALSSTSGVVAAQMNDTYLLPTFTRVYLLMPFGFVHDRNTDIIGRYALQVRVGNANPQSGRGLCSVYQLYPLYRGGLKKKWVIGREKKE